MYVLIGSDSLLFYFQFMSDNLSFYEIEFYVHLIGKHYIHYQACHTASGLSTVLQEVIMTGSCVFVAWLHEACHIWWMSDKRELLFVGLI